MERKKFLKFGKTKEEKEEVKLDTVLKKFVEKYELEGLIDKKKKEKLLEMSIANNKEEIIDEIINRIEQYKMYDDFQTKFSDFPYVCYIERLLTK